MRLEIVKEDFGIEVQVVGDQVASMAFKGHIAAIRADVRIEGRLIRRAIRRQAPFSTHAGYFV